MARTKERFIARTLATCPCFSCQQPTAEIRETNPNREPFLRCRPCSGKLVGTASVAYYLQGLGAAKIAFTPHWNWPSFQVLARRTTRPLGRALSSAKPPRIDDGRPTFGAVDCPACHCRHTALVRESDKGQIYLTCSVCRGKVWGEPMVYGYLAGCSTRQIKLYTNIVEPLSREKIREMARLYRTGPGQYYL